MTGEKDLLDVITKGRELPEGCDQWGIKSVANDLTSYGGYSWLPALKSGVAEATNVDVLNTDACPMFFGDGLCVAKNWAGMASGRFPAKVLLLLAYSSKDVLSRGVQFGKIRVSRVHVVDVVDGEALVRNNGRNANLDYAALAWANLTTASLLYASLRHANMRGASLELADFLGADMTNAVLEQAICIGAMFSGAYMKAANLAHAKMFRASMFEAELWQARAYQADFSSVDFTEADLRMADFTESDLRYAKLNGVDLESTTLHGTRMEGAVMNEEQRQIALSKGAIL